MRLPLNWEGSCETHPKVFGFQYSHPKYETIVWFPGGALTGILMGRLKVALEPTEIVSAILWFDTLKVPKSKAAVKFDSLMRMSPLFEKLPERIADPPGNG